MRVRRCSALFAAVLTLFGSGSQAEPARIRVVASFSIMADLARQVGGERVEVTTLVGPDGDPHVYAPTPADAQALASARLVVANGLGFEGWMDRLVAASGTRAAVVELSKGARLLAAEHGHAHGGSDPHAWQDVGNVRIYLANLRESLANVDPEGSTVYAANAATLDTALAALDAEVRGALAGLPPERRRVITSHDAFRYFARAYGITFVAPRGVSTEAEPSARDVARIIRQVRAEKIPALFLENLTDARLIEQIARETGARIGGRLYADTLSPPDGPAPTYVAMMRHNLRVLTEALAR